MSNPKMWPGQLRTVKLEFPCYISLDLCSRNASFWKGVTFAPANDVIIIVEDIKERVLAEAWSFFVPSLGRICHDFSWNIETYTSELFLK